MAWPVLVGSHGLDAAATIEKENRNVQATILDEGAFVTTDFRCDRVRVRVDAKGIVKQVPRVG